MSSLVPEEAIEKAAIRLAGVAAGDEGQWRGYWNAARAAVEAVAPLIVAAYRKALLDDAFPDEDSDYHYGCERLLDLVRDGLTPVLRGEGDQDGR